MGDRIIPLVESPDGGRVAFCVSFMLQGVLPPRVPVRTLSFANHYSS